ncbi:glycosyltransferase [Nonomuraea zeae]|uniref:4,4'-diaponeurosporenoate glycosyltransferase n=1 Tax=Nonomuraea zeae TaxID=1642303 RepID=A0A5S4G8H4_9ACTN|nr:glycosyltransferase [Nonomuraea zeae]TMR29306.1 glycosyltransferase [Nonomuraea zeae]
MLSVVIPAHNEAGVIGRLLTGLLREAEPGEFDVVVVANGCTDGTAEAAGAYDVRVLTTPVPSKREALRLGDAAARGYPRLYVDADIELGTADARALAAVLAAQDGPLAAAPERELALADRPWAVRAYYAIWTRLPHVRAGLFGRGVIAVSGAGNERIRALPPVMADDLAASLAFAPDERVIVPSARSVIRPPRTLADLLRRRVRAMTSVSELESAAATAGERTGLRDLAAIVAREPRLLAAAAVFVLVAVLARRRAARAIRAGDFTTWLRDDSSRA